MRVIIAVCFLAVAAVALARPEQYTDKYDGIDLDEVLQNQRLLQSYYECLMGEGKCTSEGNELKSNIGDALETGCAKCSDKHKAGVRKVIHFLVKNETEKWENLSAKYDPEKKYKQKYENEYKEATST